MQVDFFSTKLSLVFFCKLIFTYIRSILKTPAYYSVLFFLVNIYTTQKKEYYKTLEWNYIQRFLSQLLSIDVWLLGFTSLLIEMENFYRLNTFNYRHFLNRLLCGCTMRQQLLRIFYEFYDKRETGKLFPPIFLLLSLQNL